MKNHQLAESSTVKQDSDKFLNYQTPHSSVTPAFKHKSTMKSQKYPVQSGHWDKIRCSLNQLKLQNGKNLKMRAQKRYGSKNHSQSDYLIRMFDGELNEILSPQSNQQQSNSSKTSRHLTPRSKNSSNLALKIGSDNSFGGHVETISFRRGSVRGLRSSSGPREKELAPQQVIDQFIQKTKSQIHEITRSRQGLHTKFRGKMAATLANPSPYINQDQDKIYGVANFLTQQALPSLDRRPTIHLLADALPTLQRLTSLKCPINLSDQEELSLKTSDQCQSLMQLGCQSSYSPILRKRNSNFYPFSTSRTQGLDYCERLGPDEELGNSALKSTRSSAVFSQIRPIQRTIAEDPITSGFVNSKPRSPNKKILLKHAEQQDTKFFLSLNKKTSQKKNKLEIKKINWFKACIASDQHEINSRNIPKIPSLVTNFEKEVIRQSQAAKSVKTVCNKITLNLAQNNKHGSCDSLSTQGSTDVETVEPLRYPNKVSYIHRLQMSQF